MKIGIFGANGFLGSWVARKLSGSHQVTAFIRSNSNTWRINDLNISVVAYTDLKDLAKKTLDKQFDIFILLDWAGVANNLRNSHIQELNIERQKKQLIYCIRKNPIQILNFGSQAECGPVSTGIMSENLPDNPTTEYGISKVKTRIQFFEMLSKTEIKPQWFRVFSTYGALDNSEWLIPSLVDTLRRNEDFLLTKGMQEWSYLHAADFASAIEATLSDNSIDGIINLGNPETSTIKDVAHLIAELLCKKNLLKVGAVPYRVDQVMRLVPICDKLSSIGWTPQISLLNGIGHTISWLSGEAVPDLTKADASISKILPMRF